MRLAFCGAPCGAIRGDGVFVSFGRGENIDVVVEIPLFSYRGNWIDRQALPNYSQAWRWLGDDAMS